MWVFDGEEWTRGDEEGTSTKPRETPLPRYDEMMPELQVIEIPVVNQRRTPPFPLP